MGHRSTVCRRLCGLRYAPSSPADDWMMCPHPLCVINSHVDEISNKLDIMSDLLKIIALLICKVKAHSDPLPLILPHYTTT